MSQTVRGSRRQLRNQRPTCFPSLPPPAGCSGLADLLLSGLEAAGFEERRVVSIPSREGLPTGACRNSHFMAEDLELRIPPSQRPASPTPHLQHQPPSAPLPHQPLYLPASWRSYWFPEYSSCFIVSSSLALCRLTPALISPLQPCNLHFPSRRTHLPAAF